MTPIEINSIEELDAIRNDLTANYVLMRDLDFNDDASYDDVTNKSNYTTGNGWDPIGNAEDPDIRFTGTLDGQGYSVRNLYIERNTIRGVALFGSFGVNAVVENLGIIDCNVSGKSWVSAFVGLIRDASTIRNCYSTGIIIAADTASELATIGSFIGLSSNSESVVENCWSSCEISNLNTVSNTGTRVGGIVGYQSSSAAVINNCYFVGTVNNLSPVTGGGVQNSAIVGADNSGNTIGTISNCFYDTDIGPTDSNGGTGKTTAQMQNINTYTDTATVGLTTVWDMVAIGVHDDETWKIDDGNDYPVLGFQVAVSPPPNTPTVTTQAVTDIATTTATGNGNVTADGGETITERGVCWSTTTTPTTADSKATSAGTTGAFTASMTGLTADTLYYVRAYAINSEGTSYGDEVTFTTSALDNPTVTTQAATSVGSGGATLNGNVTSLGDFTPVDARFQYRETSSGTWLETSLATDITTGAYTFGLTGLTPEIEYEFRAKVEYDTDQEAFGDTLTFTTLAGDTAPVLTTNTTTLIRATMATANGEVTADGGQPVTERGFVWATTTAPDVTDNKVEVTGTTGEYSVKLTGLPAETLVYLRAYAINSEGTSYANEVEFTTLRTDQVKNPMYRNDGGILKRVN